MYPQKPGVLPWFTAYAIIMALVYLLCFGAGLFLVMATPERLHVPPSEAEAMRLQGWILTALGVPFTVLFGIAPVLPVRKWVWIYDLVLICLGLTSICCMPMTIPLLIFWLKAPTRAWFGFVQQGYTPPPPTGTYYSH
jgi:hypothetical protein